MDDNHGIHLSVHPSIHQTIVPFFICTSIKTGIIIHVHLTLFILLVGLWRLEQDSGLAAANLSVLSECGEGLMDVVCRDACNGHDVAKVTIL